MSFEPLDSGASDTFFEAQVVVVNSQGLHARPAHQVVVTANQFPCAVKVIKDGFEVDAKSIMSLMMLAAQEGTTLTIRAEGPASPAAVEALVALFESGFGE